MPKPPATFNTISPSVLRNVFDQFDKDNSGFLEANEVVGALTKIGSKITLEMLDQDGDNKVSFEEFSVFSQLTGRHTHPIFRSQLEKIAPGDKHQTVNAVAGQAHQNDAFMALAAKAWRKLAATAAFDDNALGAIFRSIDVNGDGYISDQELRQAISTMCPSLTAIDVQLMLATADTDQSGTITFDEWRKLMLHNKEEVVSATHPSRGRTRAHARANPETGNGSALPWHKNAHGNVVHCCTHTDSRARPSHRPRRTTGRSTASATWGCRSRTAPAS